MNPEQRAELLRKFTAALQREDRLRTLVRDMGPGTSKHDPKVWSEYLAALDATTQASRDYQEAVR